MLELLDFERISALSGNIYVITVSVAMFVLSSLLYIHNLMRQKKVYENMQKNREEEEQKRKDFISNINHEVRTPVNVISGMLSIIMQHPLDEQTKKHVAKIKLANLDIKNVIDNALDFNRLQGGDIKPKNKPFNFSVFIDDLKNNFALSAEEKGIKLAFIIDEHIPTTIISDEYILKSICQKLINNAIKFTEEGEVNVKVDLKESNDSIIKLEFQVMDTGVGMDKEKQKQLFNAFSQGDSSKTRTYGGLGVGLFLVKKLLTVLGSQIKIQTQLGQGSKFSFIVTLEYVKEDQSDFDICEGKKIMFVDDDIINRQIGKSLLDDLKADAAILDSGTEALKNINGTFDLVILDIKMPDMDGTEVAEKIKEMGYANIPIIALTGNSDDADLEEYKRVGINACIAKPIDFDVLKGIVAEFFKTGFSGEFKKVEKNNLSIDSNVAKFDPAKGIRLLNSDKELYKGILSKFVEDFRDAPSKIKSLISEGNKKEAEIASHSLKSVSASVGAMPLSEMAKDIEMALKNGKEINLDALTVELKAVISEAEEYLGEGMSDNMGSDTMSGALNKKSTGSDEILKNMLHKLKACIAKNDPIQSKEVIKEVSEYSFGDKDESMSKLEKAISNYDFIKAEEIASKIEGSLGE